MRVKAVPGASRDQIAGLLGDRLKIRVSAPPEGGKANRAIARVLAGGLGVLGVRASDVELVRGTSSAEKTFRIMGVTLEDARGALLQQGR